MSRRAITPLCVVIGLACVSTSGIAAAEAAGLGHPKAKVVELAAKPTACDVVVVPTPQRQYETVCPISAVRSALNLSEFAASDFGDSDDVQR
ncbi:hypothetical protein ACO2I3_16490 [Leptospira interrogans]